MVREEKKKNGQRRDTALNETLSDESKCKCGRGGLVSPIIQYGASKDEKALL